MITLEPFFFSELPESIRSAWNVLLGKSYYPNFQYDFEYMSSWTKILREDWQPFLLLAKDGETIKGIFPLMYQDEKRRGILPYRRIRFLGSTKTDFSVVLADQGNVDELVRASLSWLFSGTLRWELLILDDLVEGNPLVPVLKNWLVNNSVEADVHEGKYFYIDLQRTWEEIWKETSKSFIRANTNQARNKMTREGKWRVLINPDWNVEEIIQRASVMHMERQEELGRESFFSDKNYLDFLADVLGHKIKQNIFRSHWLEFENTFIAYTFGTEQDQVYYGWQMAIHPEYARFSPMRILLYEVIKYFHEKKLREFSFGRGESDYKEKWTKHFRVNYRFTIKNKKSVYGKSVSLLESIMK